VCGSSRHFAAGSTEFAPVGDDKIFHLSTNSQNEGPGVGYRGLFLPEGLSQTWAPACLKFCPSETFGHPTNKPPSVGSAASALPRAGAVLVENWYFSGAAPILAPRQAPLISASPPDLREAARAFDCELSRVRVQIGVGLASGELFLNWNQSAPALDEAG